MSKPENPVISKKDLPAPSRRHRYYTPEEVKLHNTANDCYVSIFHEVFDLTNFIQENYSPLMEPLIKAAGTDISHWFDPKTKDPKTCILPGTCLLSYFSPDGLYPNIPPSFPDAEWNYNFDLPWWKNENYKIGNNEINSLKELKENEQNLPVIIVFTYAKRENEVISMKKHVNKLFQDLPFIPVLARKVETKTETIKSYGLDDLLNLTLKTIKLREQNDIFDSVKNVYLLKETENTKNKILKIETDIIIQLLEKFINNYFKALSKEDFEKYIYDLISELICAFSSNKIISLNTFSLIKNKIMNRIQSYIKFYLDETKNYVNNIIEYKSIKFLDMQVQIEKVKNSSINIKNKRNREEFKELIRKFCNDNFYYIAQKYLIFLLIKDLLEDISEKLGSNIYKKMENFLSSVKQMIVFIKFI